MNFVFEKNENYWDADKVKLDKVHWAMVNDSTTSYQMFSSEQVDVSDIRSELAEQLKDDDEARFDDQAGLYFYRFNTSMEPFTNSKIRRALGLAVNQEKLLNSLRKMAEETCTWFRHLRFYRPRR